MLWRRSASLIMSTRRSWAMATTIFRKFSACRSSREEKASLPILVTLYPPRLTYNFATKIRRLLRLFSCLRGNLARRLGPNPAPGLPVHDQRGRRNGRVGARDHPDHEGKGEIAQDLAPEDEEDDGGDEGREGRQERPGQCLVHGGIDQL